MSGFTTDPLRFMAWWAKLLFFVTAIALLQLCYLLLDAVRASSAVSLLFGVAFTSLVFVVAVRTFRGRAGQSLLLGPAGARLRAPLPGSFSARSRFGLPVTEYGFSSLSPQWE